MGEVSGLCPGSVCVEGGVREGVCVQGAVHGCPGVHVCPRGMCPGDVSKSWFQGDIIG